MKHEAAASLPPLRIVAVAETWQGANSYAFIRAFRRAGHSVSVISENEFAAPQWQSLPLRIMRRLSNSLIVRDFNAAIERDIRQLRPHLLFVFKGFMVQPRAILTVQDTGGVAVNFWPDVSVTAHGPAIPRALPRYDWVFTTKTFGIADMHRELGVTRASFLPHAFDPETHRPMALSQHDVDRYGCDISFIGTWSPKKEALLTALQVRLPQAKIKIWGAQWEHVKTLAPGTITRQCAFGAEYAKAIAASKINVTILSEVRTGASSGDQITSRTFHIPASGGFMLHERTEEVQDYFTDGEDCAMFTGAQELTDKAAYYLAHGAEREKIARAGTMRCHACGYSIDDRAETVLAKARELLKK